MKEQASRFGGKNTPGRRKTNTKSWSGYIWLHVASCGCKKEGIGEKIGEVSKDKVRMGTFPQAIEGLWILLWVIYKLRFSLQGRKKEVHIWKSYTDVHTASHTDEHNC